MTRLRPVAADGLLSAAKRYHTREADDNAVANVLYSDTRARGIARQVALKYKLPLEQAEELFQRSAIVLFGGVLAKMNEPDGIYSLWYAIVQRTAQGLRREGDGVSSLSDTIDDLDEGDRPAQQFQDYDAPDPSSAASASMARRAFEARLAKDPARQALLETMKLPQFDTMVMVDPEVKTLKELPRVPRKEPAPILDSGQEILVSSRKKLAMTIEGFADALEIKRDRLASYLYGRSSVPAEIIDKCNKLVKQATPGSNSNASSATVSRHVAQWDKALGGRGPAALAGLIGVSEDDLHAMETGAKPVTKERLAAFDEMVARVSGFLHPNT